MTDIDALVNRLLQHKDEIFKRVEQESIDVYKYLMAAYPACVDDNVFRFVYRSFYGLDRAFLTDEFKSRYFTLLKNGETSLEDVLKELHEIPIRKGKKTWQLSFATKLRHTIDKDLPIYDKNIASILKLHPKESRLDCYIKIYDQLKLEHDALLKDKDVKKLISEFKARYDAKSISDAKEPISDAKALDFMLWALGKPTKEKDRKGKDEPHNLGASPEVSKQAQPIPSVL